MGYNCEVRGKERVMRIAPNTGGKILVCGVCGMRYAPKMNNGRLPNGYRRCPHGCVWPDLTRGNWNETPQWPSKEE